MPGPLNPTLGELIDRYLIVRLKILHTTSSAVERKKLLHDERATLLHAITRRHPQGRRFERDRLVRSLARIHGKLWEDEDRVRNTDIRLVTALARLAKEISLLNDERSACIARISEAAGERIAGKVYGAKAANGTGA